MIVFLDEENTYLNWVRHHHTGFVLDCLRQPSKRHLVLHRANCASIKRSPSKRTHWTTGRHMKGCSLKLDELKAWAVAQTQSEAAFCPECSPDEEHLDLEVHLTRMDRGILDYVLEIAACHLGEEDHDYALTVGMVARCIGKTPGQLNAALGRLETDGLLMIHGHAKPGEALPARTRVMPTIKAIKTLPDYADVDDEQVARELESLNIGTSDHACHPMHAAS